MIFTVQTQTRQLLGTVEIAGGALTLIGSHDDAFAHRVRTLASSGVRELRGIYDDAKGVHVIAARIVPIGDPAFAPALRDALVREGLLVTERGTMVEREIRGLLGSYADEEDRQKLLAQLPSMTVLEQTMLLQTLRRGAH